MRLFGTGNGGSRDSLPTPRAQIDENAGVSRAEFHRASDGRAVAMVVRHDFDDFRSHPPTFATEAEREWLKEHYQVGSPERERATKAHLTADELPLQVTVLNRPAHSLVKPHYHVNERASTTDTRHQVMVCLSGSVRVGIYAREGEHIVDVVLETGDLALLYEGHSIETLEDGTRLLEIKQGPMPSNPFDDNVAIVGPEAAAR